MIDIQLIRANPEEAKERLANRGVHVDVDELLSLDERRRKLQQELDEQRAERRRQAETRQRTPKAVTLKGQIEELEAELRRITDGVKKKLADLPNLPLPDVPVGSNSSANVVVKEEGKKPNIANPKDYLTLAKALDLIDIEQAALVSGSRFAYLKREAVLLEFAMIQHAFNVLTKDGFIPMIPPVLVREEYISRMGYLTRRDKDEVYILNSDGLALVGTAEHAIGPYHARHTFSPDDLPTRYVGFSTSFRREAGSYGKDTKGIFRVHQFDKIEMYVICEPTASSDELKRLTKLQERLVADLGLPYRMVKLCTGELSHPAAMSYDLECWLPGQKGGSGEYRETHSASNTTDFQARTLGMSVRAPDGKKHLPHTLNATAFAIGRTLIAILENFQQSDGSVLVPEVLRPYLPFDRIRR